MIRRKTANLRTCKIVACNPCRDLCFHIAELFHECARVFWDVLSVLCHGYLGRCFKPFQVNFLNRLRAEGSRGILRSTISCCAGTTSLAGRFTPPSTTGLAEYEYNGGCDTERTGGRRNRCLSLRPVGGAGSDTALVRIESTGPFRFGDGDCVASAGCRQCWLLALSLAASTTPISLCTVTVIGVVAPPSSSLSVLTT